MTLKPELFNAILSMDAYNRGYDASISINSEAIGSATLGIDSSELGTVILDGLEIDRHETIGFYALTYNYNGETIIAYRGTDYPENDTFPPKDVFHGWSLGGAIIASEQGKMAIEFFREVANLENGGNDIDPRDANISLTGHSLGGGLSGYVGGLYRQEADVFDSMTFYLAANRSYDLSDPNHQDYIASHHDDVFGLSRTPTEPEFSKIEGYYIEGEILGTMLPLRGGQAELNPLTLGYEEDDLSGTDLHSMASLVIRMFADEDEVDSNDWEAASQYFWPTMYDNDFARDIGMDDPRVDGELRRTDQYDAILRMVIAYSALDEGERPFGDTAIRALYNDANDLGQALQEVGDSSNYNTDMVKFISEVFVSFSGLLGLNSVLQGSVQGVDFTQGVLTYEPEMSVLELNLSDELWGQMPSADANALDEAHTNVVTNFLKEAGLFDDVVTHIMQRWDNINDENDAIKAFDGIVFSPDLSVQNYDISNYVSETLTTVLFVGGYSAETVQGSINNDFIYGGIEHDYFISSQGEDIFFGGFGVDTVDYSMDIAAVSINLAAREGTDGWGDTDTLAAIENLIGTDFAAGDLLIGNAWDNELSGGGGNDELHGDGVFYSFWNQFQSTYDFESLTFDPGYLGTDVNGDGSLYADLQRGWTDGNGDNPIYAADYSGADVLHGQDGDDKLYGGYGNDELYGGADDDWLHPGRGSDYIHGGGGVNTLSYDDLDTYFLISIMFPDTWDIYEGFILSPRIIDLAQQKTFYQDGSVDTWQNIQIIEVGSGFDTILGTETGDWTFTSPDLTYAPYTSIILDYRQISGSITLDRDADDVLIHKSGGVDTLTHEDGPFPVAELYAPEGGMDVIQYSDDDNVVRARLVDGQYVDDGYAVGYSSYQLSGFDKIDLGGGDDVFYKLDFDTRVEGGDGTDILIYETGYSFYMNASGTYKKTENGPAIDMSSNTGFERLIGTGGGDVYTGGGTFYDSQGSDTYEYNGVDITIHTLGSAYSGGTDVLDIQSGLGLTVFSDEDVHVTYGSDIEIEAVDQNDPSQRRSLLTFDNSDGVIDEVNLGWITRDKVEYYGDDGGDDPEADTIIGDEYGNNLYGLFYADTLKGEGGDDHIYGGSGYDTLEGGIGNDHLYAEVTGAKMYGDEGQDRFYILDNTAYHYVNGGSGIDTIVLQTGTRGDFFIEEGLIKYNDEELVDYRLVEILEFSDGSKIHVSELIYDYDETSENDVIIMNEDVITNDVIHAGEGNDFVETGDGNDIIYGGSGNDRIYSGNGNNIVYGDAGDDRLSSYDGISQIYGGTGDDEISVGGFGYGEEGNDILYGGDVDDLLDGGADDDEIWGGAGDDELKGGAGNDIIYGDTLFEGSGDDLLDGGADDDELKGGFGDDIYVFSSGMDIITETGGTDTIKFAAGSSITDFDMWRTFEDDLVIQEIATGNQITVKDHFSDITIRELYYGNYPFPYSIGEEFRYLEILGFNNGNDLVLTSSLQFETRGSEAGEIITDTKYDLSADGTIKAGGGNDIVIASIGNDILDGETGQDTIDYRTHFTAINVSNDVATYLLNTSMNETDTLISIENIIGSTFNDVIAANSGDNIIIGMMGHDILSGGDGNDTVGYAYDMAGVAVDLGAGTATDGWGDTDTLTFFENIIGSDYADSLTGDNSANTLSGGLGDDTLIGGSGGDVLDGGDGVDTVDYSDAASGVTAYIINGVATNDGDGGSDTLTAVENLIGSDYNDDLRGDNNVNVISGGDGDDYVISYDGNDTLYGGAGIDLVKGGDGDDILYGGDGDDDAVWSGGVKILDGGLFGGAGNDILYGEAGNDDLRGEGGDDTLYGGDDNDLLNGESGNDTLYGGTGNDTLRGESGEDVMYGEDGNDDIRSGGDNDILYGGDGNDLLRGGDGDDILSGGAGTNNLYGDAGVDTLIYTVSDVLNGYDRLWDYEDGVGGDIVDISTLLMDYTPGTDDLNDFVNAYLDGDGTRMKVDIDGTDSTYGWVTTTWFRGAGDVGDEQNLIADGNLIIHNEVTVTGDSNANEVFGNNLNNSLSGLGGDDDLYGANGDDILSGGDGSDTLHGGAGADTFVFLSGETGTDTVLDFTTGDGDALDLSDLLSSYDPMTDALADFVEITDSGSASIVKVDVTGSGTFGTGTEIATLTGVTGLTDEDALVTSGNLVVA